MKLVRHAALALLMIMALLACTVPGDRRDEDLAAIAALKQQSEHWDQAIVRKDAKAIAANMSDDFRQIRSNGAVANRQEFLDFVTSTELSIDPYTVDDLDVRIYGDTALLSGTTRMTGRYAGTAFKSHYRYVDVYVRRDGQWQVCNVQITEMPEE